jgi:membrane protein implicated in regulation of membrane protease activity
MDKVIWVWLAAAIVFIMLEVFTPGFIFACFVVGAIAAGVTALITDSFTIQGAVFAVVSIVLIPVTRPLAKKITKPSPVITNVDGLIGKTGFVKNEVSETAGQIVVDDQVWQARANNVIPPGQKVKIMAVEGAKLKVENF